MPQNLNEKRNRRNRRRNSAASRQFSESPFLSINFRTLFGSKGTFPVEHFMIRRVDSQILIYFNQKPHIFMYKHKYDRFFETSEWILTLVDFDKENHPLNRYPWKLPSFVAWASNIR